MKRWFAVLLLVAACSTLFASVALAKNADKSDPYRFRGGAVSPQGFQWRGGGYFF